MRGGAVIRRGNFVVLDDILKKRLLHIESKGLLRKLRSSTYSTSEYGDHKVIVGGEETDEPLTCFSCNDYMGLASNALVKQAAIDAIERYGVGACASRLITGNHSLYEELEKRIAEIYGTEASLVFSSGYLANIGGISALVDRHDMILADKYIHASSMDGIKLSGAKLYRFAHNDVAHCEELLNEYRKLHKHCLIVVENVYGMDGDVAPLDDLIKVAKKYDSWVAVDAAHGFGMVEEARPDIYIGTLSKAVGSLGGYICASKVTIEYIINKARSFIYTTALPPAIVAAATAAIDLYLAYKDVPLRLAKEFCQILGLRAPQSHIVSLIMRDSQSALDAERTLAKRGILAVAIRPPTVPTPRLRFVFTAAHKLIDIHRLCNVLRQDSILENSVLA
ncbi:8-amino-7-oxononanoate synthase [Anaplasma bovis]